MPHETENRVDRASVDGEATRETRLEWIEPEVTCLDVQNTEIGGSL